jgi:hypothetical protein
LFPIGYSQLFFAKIIIDNVRFFIIGAIFFISHFFRLKGEEQAEGKEKLSRKIQLQHLQNEIFYEKNIEIKNCDKSLMFMIFKCPSGKFLQFYYHQKHCENQFFFFMKKFLLKIKLLCYGTGGMRDLFGDICRNVWTHKMDHKIHERSQTISIPTNTNCSVSLYAGGVKLHKV